MKIHHDHIVEFVISAVLRKKTLVSRSAFYVCKHALIPRIKLNKNVETFDDASFTLKLMVKLAIKF